MKIISSRQHPLVKLIASLSEQKYRRRYQLFVAEGVRVCSTLLDAGQELEYFCVHNASDIPESYSIAPEKIVLVNSEVMSKISNLKEPSDCIGVFKIPQAPDLSQLSPGLVLACLQDPGNVGTLIRTSVACGITSIVCIEGADPWSPKVVQATAGTIGFTKVFELSWAEFLAAKKDSSIAALVVKDGKNITQQKLQNAYLVVGNEGQGIPHEWLQQCDIHVTLTMHGPTESLNAAIAGSIALYLTHCLDSSFMQR